jgi:hypothetical protein
VGIGQELTRVQRPLPVAGSTNLYCAGYVQSSPIDTKNRLVGAVEEQEQFNFKQSDYVYVNMGADEGVKVGDTYAIVRPRGQVSAEHSNKRNLGYYVQEIGSIEIVSVKPKVSAARVKSSCDTFMLGDLVQPWEVRVSPQYSLRSPLDRFADPSGNIVGRIFMSRDNHEMMTRDQIVFIDLGSEDNVKAGDYLTIYRPLGKGHVWKTNSDESVTAESAGFRSAGFEGGKFSNQAGRKSVLPPKAAS